MGGPLEEKKKRLLVNVALLVALCGTPVWATASTVAYSQVEMELVQKTARLRYISRYRTFLAPAVNILAGIPLLEVKIPEIAEVYKATKATRTLRERRLAKNHARQNAMKMLYKTFKGEWTRELIDYLDT